MKAVVDAEVAVRHTQRPIDDARLRIQDSQLP
jgi:hypothetical protein